MRPKNWLSFTHFFFPLQLLPAVDLIFTKPITFSFFDVVIDSTENLNFVAPQTSNFGL